MQRFYVKLVKDGFGANAALLPADLVLTPQTWSASDRGGPKHAEIVAAGSAESLAALTGWLGDRVQIYGGDGTLLWHGVLWDIELSIDRVVVQLSLDVVYNRVAVIYPYQLADGSEESRTTAWAEDANSINRYGKRELLYGKPAQFTNAAEEVRDHLLERLKSAHPTISTQSESRFAARLSARGLWEKAGSVYFTNPDGLIEHRDESGSVHVGLHIVSDQISFGTSTPGGEADEIHIASGDFDPLAVGDTFTISGASNAGNNDTYTIASRDASNQIGISGSFVAEAAGADVKISVGAGVSQDNIAMEFEPATSWVCTHVAVKVRRVGSPSDSFRIGIYPDVSGSPGTVLTANETLGSALFSELTWTEFAFATPVTLSASTKYWVGIRRTGSANLSDGYEVALDENLGFADGVLRVYNGSSWVARDPDADMPFRVIGEISSTAQIAKCVDAVDDFRHTLVQVDSEIPVRQFAEDERTAMEEMNEMLDAGVASGERLIAYVANDDSVIVTTAPQSSFGTPNLVLGADGKLRYPNGGEYPPGMLIFGCYVDVDSLLLLDGLGIKASRGSATYVAESTYDANSGMLSIADEGALDPFAALTTRKG